MLQYFKTIEKCMNDIIIYDVLGGSHLVKGIEHGGLTTPNMHRPISPFLPS